METETTDVVIPQVTIPETHIPFNREAVVTTASIIVIVGATVFVAIKAKKALDRRRVLRTAEAVYE